MTSFEKIRESIDEVVAQVMLRHAEQLRNEVGERVRVHVEADAQHLGGVEQQLLERSEQLQTLEQQLAQTRNEISEKQRAVETVEQQLRDAQQAHATTQGRVGELENNLKSETERLGKHAQELEQLLDMSQEDVKQLQKKEEEQRSRVQELEQRLEATEKESLAKLEGKERELLEQVHLLEELLVQGQNAREQQLEAKDQELKAKLEQIRIENEARLKELTEQLADRDKVMKSQGGELQERIVRLEKELAESQSQLNGVRGELQESQSVFESTQRQLDEAHANFGKSEGELRKQLNDNQSQAQQREQEWSARIAEFEKKISDFAAAEKDWKQREQELLGHRDKVLSSSAEATEAGQKALKTALEDQTRLQAQLDGLMGELARVREDFVQAKESHRTREQELENEVAAFRQQLSGASAAPAIAASVDHTAAIQGVIGKIQAVRSQTEILKALLEGAAQFAGRTGIMVVQARNAAGWAAVGFGPDAEFRRLSVECSRGLAAKVVQSRKYVQGPVQEFDQKLIQQFGAPQDTHAHIFPLVVRERVAAFLYADCGTQNVQPVATSAIEAVVQAAGTWLEDQAQGKGSPEKSAPMAMAAAAAVAPMPEPRAIAQAVAAAAGSSVPREAPAAPENGDASRQKARRFAKLLVDEIKLYNKDAVEQGRRNSDLYDRLRESIDKSRASYDKRWGKTITDVDYFREELVRNLAENNPTILGSNFR